MAFTSNLMAPNIYRGGGLSSLNPFAQSQFPAQGTTPPAPSFGSSLPQNQFAQPTMERLQPDVMPQPPGMLQPFRPDVMPQPQQDLRAMFPDYTGPKTMADTGVLGRGGSHFTPEFTQYLDNQGYKVDMTPTHTDQAPIILNPQEMLQPFQPDVMPPVMLPEPSRPDPSIAPEELAEYQGMIYGNPNLQSMPIKTPEAFTPSPGSSLPLMGEIGGMSRPEVMPQPEVTPRPGPQPMLQPFKPRPLSPMQTPDQLGTLTSLFPRDSNRFAQTMRSDEERLRPPSIQLSRKHGGSLSQTVLNLLRNLS
jgi:hypothetical protein